MEESKDGSAANDTNSVGDHKSNEIDKELGESGERALQRAVEREKKAKEELRLLQEERNRIQKEKEESELRALEEAGKTKELNEILKKRALEAESKFNDYVAKNEVQKISDKLKLMAVKNGASIPEDVVAIFMPQLRDKKLSEVSDELLADLVNEAKTSRPFWFKKDVKINDMPPRNGVEGIKNINSMSVAELKKAYAEKKASRS